MERTVVTEQLAQDLEILSDLPVNGFLVVSCIALCAPLFPGLPCAAVLLSEHVLWHAPRGTALSLCSLASFFFLSGSLSVFVALGCVLVFFWHATSLRVILLFICGVRWRKCFPFRVSACVNEWVSTCVCQWLNVCW